MKILRYQDSSGKIGYAAERDGQAFELEGGLYDGFRETGRPADVRKRLAPLAPAQIVGIGLNYRHHAAESGAPVPEWPVVFYKNLGAVQNPGDPIQLPKNLQTFKPDYECELAVVLGKDCRDATEENALDFVLGYTVGNDVSARDWQREWGGSQWCRAKSFDTFCPLGPVIVTTDEIPDPQTLRLSTKLNGETVQDWNTNDMIFSVRKLIAFLSADTTLPKGTVVLTGTPQGVGMGRKPPLWLKDGDEVVMEIEKIGVLSNPVVG